MSMIWNWDTRIDAVVFKWWTATTAATFVLSVVICLLLGIGFEGLKALTVCITQKIQCDSNSAAAQRKTPRKKFIVLALRSAIYALNTFYSLFLMLIFMTYNGFMIFSVVAGAGIGHFLMLWFDCKASNNNSKGIRTRHCSEEEEIDDDTVPICH